MKNQQINNFRNKPVCDGHFHPHERISLDETVSIYKRAFDYFELDKVAVQCLPSYSKVNNYEALYLKNVFPNVYINCGLLHGETFEPYEIQAKKLFDMGCDGFKMLEGKPDYRKQLGKPLDHPSFDKFYAFLEQNKLPLLLHYGDPREFWDKDKIPKWALERGWLYDSSFVHFDEGQKEIERVLEKFPKLHLILAHFFFTSDNYDYAVNLMEKCQNVFLDLTPGTEMYFNFEQDSRWRDFFIKYADRILYGTDTYNWQRDERTYEDQFGHAVNLVRGFLERKEPFFDNWTQRELKKPFGLPNEVLDKIYCENFVRLYGKKPRKLENSLLKAECEKAVSWDISQIEKENISKIIKEI